MAHTHTSTCTSILRTTTTLLVALALHISSVAPPIHPTHSQGAGSPVLTYLKSKRLSKLYRCGFRRHSNAEAPVAQPKDPGAFDYDSEDAPLRMPAMGMGFGHGCDNRSGCGSWLTSTSDFTRIRTGAVALNIARGASRVRMKGIQQFIIFSVI